MAARVPEARRPKVPEIRKGDTVVVHTAGGRVQAKHVALCCNAYMDQLSPRLRARIMPVGTYIVATEPLGSARIESLMDEL